MTISVAVTFLFLYIHYEVGKDKWPWKLFYILGDTTFPPFLLIPKTSIYDFFIYQKHQCSINLYVLHFQLPSLFCISITIMRLWKSKNHDIYFTFCMTQGFLSSSSYPEPQFEIPSRPWIPMSNQLVHRIFPSTFLYEHKVIRVWKRNHYVNFEIRPISYFYWGFSMSLPGALDIIIRNWGSFVELVDSQSCPQSHIWPVFVVAKVRKMLEVRPRM